MSTDIDIGLAYTVQDLANELKVNRSGVPPDDQAAARARWTKSLWSKVFVRSVGSERRPDAPAVPDDLAEQMAGLDSLDAVILLVARARATVSGGDTKTERTVVGENIRRFLETPQGRERQAYLDAHPTP